MIVVDTNVIAYLFIKGDKTAEAESVLETDPHWIAPVLWRSEMRNILALYVRQKHLSLYDASVLMKEAELLMKGREYELESEKVLALAGASGCSAYDCEFVALAEQLDLLFVTSDKKLLSAFPHKAVSMQAFGI